MASEEGNKALSRFLSTQLTLGIGDGHIMNPTLRLYTTVKSPLIGLCSMSFRFSPLVRPRNFLAFLSFRVAGRSLSGCFSPPILEKEILDYLAHGQIISHPTVSSSCEPPPYATEASHLAVSPNYPLISTG